MMGSFWRIVRIFINEWVREGYKILVEGFLFVVDGDVFIGDFFENLGFDVYLILNLFFCLKEEWKKFYGWLEENWDKFIFFYEFKYVGDLIICY